MSELVARTGRHQQRYEHGCRLIAGCIPYKYRCSEATDGDTFENNVEVLMINSTSGPGLLFPKRVHAIFDAIFIMGHPETVSLCFSTVVRLRTSDLPYPTVGGSLRGTEGGWENDETVEEAAVREALEEAGVRGNLMHYLGEYHFKSKTLQDEFSPEGFCKAAMFALLVIEELDSWPEQCRRERSWLTISEASKCCRHSWMKEALQNGFAKWQADGMIKTMKDAHSHSDASSSPDQQ